MSPLRRGDAALAGVFEAENGSLAAFCRSEHFRPQPMDFAIDGETAVALVDGDRAFGLGEALGHQSRRRALMWHRGETEPRVLVDVQTRAVDDLHYIGRELAGSQRDDAGDARTHGLDDHLPGQRHGVGAALRGGERVAEHAAIRRSRARRWSVWIGHGTTHGDFRFRSSRRGCGRAIPARRARGCSLRRRRGWMIAAVCWRACRWGQVESEKPFLERRAEKIGTQR